MDFLVILRIIYYSIGLYFLFYSFYWFFLSIMGMIYSKSKRIKNNDYIKIDNLVILFPAYKPDLKLLEAVKAAKAIKNIPKAEILIILQEDVNNIKELLLEEEITIVEKNFKNVNGNPYHEVLRFSASVCKELNASHILLLDKDNIANNDFINQIFSFGNPNADVWQGKRKALNQENNWATYDSFSEKLNDMLLREAKQALDLPPELSGSAILFKTEVFENAVNNLDSRAPGMDKNLLIQLLLSNKIISYVPEAIVWEEKTASSEVLQTQRIRWFGNQYFNALYWGIALLKKQKPACLDYLITLYRPPRSIQIVLLPILMILELLTFKFIEIFSYSFLFTIGGILLFLIKENAWSSAYSIAQKLPIMAFRNLKSAANGVSKKQQGKFISTERRLNPNEKLKKSA
ncbi:glycosyltransferase [Chondrinema litorale]|uniref:glycosyltransferase n=1 Tax=Chondrinema litorale TaxID=2994555 RepID=UPI002542F6AE|nr:glycosyltransferase family 2 protein [Chondrinema litorale]UZR98020.1 glycosyltransferase family 2 protein [Chondrinema litorale]